MYKQYVGRVHRYFNRWPDSWIRENFEGMISSNIFRSQDDDN